MGWVASIAPIVDTLSKKNGRYDERTPKMRPTDMIATLGLFSAGIPGAINRIADGGIQLSRYVSADGGFQIPSGVAFIAGDSIDAPTYCYRSVPSIVSLPWRRMPSSLTDAQVFKARASGVLGDITYEPCRTQSYLRNDQLEQVHFLRQTMADYQRSLDAAATAVTMYPGTIASSDLCKSFMSGLRALAADLEVLQEHPPTSLTQDLKGATDAAIDASAEAAGGLAASAGNLVGKVAGNVASGFFNAANLTTLAVAGVVGIVALKRYGVL